MPPVSEAAFSTPQSPKKLGCPWGRVAFPLFISFRYVFFFFFERRCFSPSSTAHSPGDSFSFCVFFFVRCFNTSFLFFQGLVSSLGFEFLSHLPIPRPPSSTPGGGGREIFPLFNLFLLKNLEWCTFPSDHKVLDLNPPPPPPGLFFFFGK